MSPHAHTFFRFEDRLIGQFRIGAFVRALQQMSDDEFQSFLIELGHLSSHFVRWYETAKLGLDAEPAKELVRRILRDEIPANAPTHQEDRLADLLQIGLTKEQILCSPASVTTHVAIDRLYELVRFPQTEYDLRVLVTLRIAGEVLPGELYGYVVPELERRFGLQRELSRFYFPHWQHDQKEHEGGHADQFAQLLSKLITDACSLATAQDTARKAFDTRMAFYAQFVHQEHK